MVEGESEESKMVFNQNYQKVSIFFTVATKDELVRERKQVKLNECKKKLIVFYLYISKSNQLYSGLASHLSSKIEDNKLLSENLLENEGK